MLRIITMLWTLMASKIYERMESERGATAVEYGLIVALIAVAIIGGVAALGGQLDELFQDVSEEVDTTIPTTNG